MATVSLLAHVLISKFIDATPLYRQQQQWKRLGIDLGRALLSSWVVKCGVLLTCSWELMQQDLQSSDYVQADETTLQVLHEDGRLEIDNNAAERSIKPFVIGRKNWLFCNTSNGANASAVIYSMLQSAKANELPLIQWLTYVLEELPRCTNDDQRRALLPHRFDIQRLENRIPDD